MRANQQSRDFNLAVVLITSVVMFLFCHAPRYATSNYEIKLKKQVFNQFDGYIQKAPTFKDIFLGRLMLLKLKVIRIYNQFFTSVIGLIAKKNQ